MIEHDAPTPLLRRFAERARREPALLGARLEAIEAARGWDDDAARGGGAAGREW